MSCLFTPASLYTKDSAFFSPLFFCSHSLTCIFWLEVEEPCKREPLHLPWGQDVIPAAGLRFKISLNKKSLFAEELMVADIRDPSKQLFLCVPHAPLHAGTGSALLCTVSCLQSSKAGDCWH